MNRLLEHRVPGEGCDRCRIIVDYAGAQARYASLPETSAHCFIMYSNNTHAAIVVMVDGNAGSSITNAAENIIQFLFPIHLGRRGIPLSAVRWLYRDTTGAWDEILPEFIQNHSSSVRVEFRPLGDRSIGDVITALVEAGLHPVKEDFERIELASKRGTVAA